MDYIKRPSIQAASQFSFSQSHNQSRFIKLLLSVSVFSIILSYSSLIFILLHSFNAFTSSASVNFFSYSLDKNYMFLLCNGLLVFIVKNSGLIGASLPESSNLNNDEHVLKSTDSRQRVVELAETKASEAEEQVTEEEVGEEQGIVDDEILVAVEEEDKRVFSTENEEEEGCCFSTENEEEEGCRNSLVMVEYHDVYEEEEEEEEEEGVELLSTEEFNKKCDEFIRKMKQGIKLEVQVSNSRSCFDVSEQKN